MEQRVNLREVNQHLARYVKAAEAGERIVITRRGKPVALLSPLPREKRSLSAAQEAALERLLSRVITSVAGLLRARFEQIVAFAAHEEAAFLALG